jgi:lipopolysaccharide export system protein LptA
MPLLYRRALCILAAIVPALALALPACAQLGPADASAPINVQSDSGIEWQQNKQIYIARGNAVATRGTGEIHGDTLIAHYREAKGAENNTEIYRVEADGNVTIKRDNRIVVGDHADYDVDQGVGIVRGKALKMTTAADTVTARDTLEWYDTKQVAVARGDAVAVHNGRTIKGDTLTAYMVKDTAAGGPGHPPNPAQPAKAAPAKGAAPGKPGAPAAAGPATEASKIDRLDAQGHVVVVSAQDIGHGDYGVYNATTGICTLLGNVVITRGKDVITGQYAVMDMNKNISRILPASSLPGSTQQRVQGVFVRQDNAGQPATDKKQPAADKKAPAAAAPKTP